MTDLVPIPNLPAVDEGRRTFLGVPIIGEKSSYSESRSPQWDLATFQRMIQALIDEPFFLGWGWTQYTPYFNDGEPCYFSIHGEPWIRTVGQEDCEPEDWYDHEMSVSNHAVLGELVYPPGGRWVRGVEPTYQGEHEALFKKAWTFSTALTGGHFNDVVLDLFGDHAEISMSRDKIVVDSYSHD